MRQVYLAALREPQRDEAVPLWPSFGPGGAYFSRFFTTVLLTVHAFAMDRRKSRTAYEGQISSRAPTLQNISKQLRTRELGLGSEASRLGRVRLTALIPGPNPTWCFYSSFPTCGALFSPIKLPPAPSDYLYPTLARRGSYFSYLMDRRETPRQVDESRSSAFRKGGSKFDEENTFLRLLASTGDQVDNHTT